MQTSPLQRSVWALLLITFVGSLGFTITLPLMPYYAATFGADPLTVGLLTASYALCALFAGPVLGRLSDRQGRRPWLLFSQLGTLFGFVITALGGSIAMLFLGRVIDGISGGNQVIAQAYAADVTRPEERTRVYALMGAAFGVGAIVGPVLGGGLSQFGYSTPFWVAALISALTLLATLFFLPEPPRAQAAPIADTHVGLFGALHQAVSEPTLRRLLSLYAVMALIFGLFVASIGLFLQLQLGVTPLIAGLMVAYYGVVSVAMQVGLVGMAVRWLGERRMAVVALPILALAMGTLAVASTILLSLVGVTLLVLGMSLLRPAVTSLISQAAGVQRQGIVMGATQSVQSLADTITPVIGGGLIAVGVPGAPFLAATLIALMGLLLTRPLKPGLVPGTDQVGNLTSPSYAERG